MLINFSNHPSSLWSDKQLATASRYGKIVDIPFPTIDPQASEIDVEYLVVNYIQKIGNIADSQKDVIHVMGEMNFTFRFVGQMRAMGYTCIASTTERKVEYNNKGEKVVQFDFVQFREY